MGFLMGLRKDRKVESDSETVVNLSISIFLGAPRVCWRQTIPLNSAKRFLTDESCTGQTWPPNHSFSNVINQQEINPKITMFMGRYIV